MRLYRLSFVGGQEKISPTSTRENDGKKTAFSHDKKSRQMNWTAICWSCSFDDIVMLGKLHRSRFFLARFVCRPLFDGSPPTSIFIQFLFFSLSAIFHGNFVMFCCITFGLHRRVVDDSLFFAAHSQFALSFVILCGTECKMQSSNGKVIAK